MVDQTGKGTTLADFDAPPEEGGSMVAPAGAGADPAEYDWSWGAPVPDADPATFQEIWNSREYATENKTTGSLEAPGGTGMGGGGGGGTLAGGAIAGLDQDQSQNLRIILRVGQERGLSRYAQAIAVMTALGESGLRNLNYGDRDSIGMFQERSSWGSVEDRLDPWQTARRFYDRLMGVDGWQKLKPTIAAHKAQVNADPNHYTKWWGQAAGAVQAAYGG